MIDVTMPIHKDVPKKFMASFDRYEPIDKDHTAISTAKLCFRKYFYQIVLGMIPNTEPIYFAWGRAYHTFREVLDKTYGYGHNTPRPFDEEKARDALATAAQKGLEVWRTQGKDQPVGSKLAFMTSGRLLESFKRAFFDHWVIERKRGNIEILAIEQPFVIELPDGERTSGRIDRLERWLGKIWVRDYKASAKNPDYFSRSVTPNDQATRYAYAAEKLSGEEVAGVVFEQLYNNNHTKTKVHGPQIVAHTAGRTQFELETWEREEMHFRDILDMCREKDNYPMIENNCSWCVYHSVCSRGQSEAAQMYQLKSNFEVRPWDNTKIGYIDDEVKGS